MLKGFRVSRKVITLYCDNLNGISISKNLVQHSRMKHINIRHHYIWNLIEDKIIDLRCVSTEDQLAGIFTKGLDASRYESLQSS